MRPAASIVVTQPIGRGTTQALKGSRGRPWLRLAGAFEHGLGGFGQRHLVAALCQPQRHVAKASTDVQYAQRAIRQGFGQIRLQHCQPDRTFGAAVDFFGETGRQLVEMTIAHQLNLRSLSASLLRTTSFMSRPNSLHNSNR